MSSSALYALECSADDVALDDEGNSGILVVDNCNVKTYAYKVQLGSALDALILGLYAVENNVLLAGELESIFLARRTLFSTA